MKFLIALFECFMHSFSITYFQLFSITGIFPPLIASRTLCTNSTNIAPVNVFFIKIFGFVFFVTLFLNIFACCTNSFRSCSSGNRCMFCKSLSFSTGRTITKQSLSGKYVRIKERTLFFSSIISLEPFMFFNAFSRYCFSVITFPSWSSNLSEKSLKSQNKVGKYCASSSSFSIDELFLNLIVLLKFSTKLKLLIAFSSIVPNELKINKELINIAIKNILLSWFTSSS